MSDMELSEVVEQHMAMPEPLRADQMIARVKAVQECYKTIMQEDVHYGKIPGCGPKPTLLKPGAEKLLVMFQLAPQIFCEDLSGPDEIRYRVKVRVTHQLTGMFIGEGVGECSSGEKKYRSNAPVDIANTILKMAKKRAMVDAALTCTGASDMFTQDIEDMDIGKRSAREKPKRQSAAKPTGGSGTSGTSTSQGNGDDPSLISDPQRKRLYAIYKGNEWDDTQAKEYIKAIFGYDSSKDIKKGRDYEAICLWFEANGPEVDWGTGDDEDIKF